MRPRIYLRAYMAGIVVPTLFLLVIVTGFSLVSLYGDTSGEMTVERVGRVIMFPMAVVPNLWGLWNMLHVRLRSRGRWPSLGVHGALLPLLLIPGGLVLSSTHIFDMFTIPLGFALIAAPAGMAVYYLLWKHFVGVLNAELGIA